MMENGKQSLNKRWLDSFTKCLQIDLCENKWKAKKTELYEEQRGRKWCNYFTEMDEKL